MSRKNFGTDAALSWSGAICPDRRSAAQRLAPVLFRRPATPDQPAALLLHGLGDEADTWRHLIEPLSQRWRVIAPDLPGFGRSDQPRRAYTLDFLRGCLFELLEVLAVPEVLLVGHSLGGMLAHGMLLEQTETRPFGFSKPERSADHQASDLTGFQNLSGLMLPKSTVWCCSTARC